MTEYDEMVGEKSVRETNFLNKFQTFFFWWNQKESIAENFMGLVKMRNSYQTKVLESIE